MKLLRKSFYILFAVLLCVGFTACSKEDDKSSKPNTSKNANNNDNDNDNDNGGEKVTNGEGSFTVSGGYNGEYEGVASFQFNENGNI